MPLDFKQAIKNAIHACADASGDLYIKAGLGTPGAKIKLFGETSDTGLAFTPLPKAMDCIIEGIASIVASRRDVIVTKQLSNATGGVVSAGSIVRIGGTAGTFTLASSSNNTALLGITYESVSNGQVGEVALAGIVNLKLVSGLTPQPRDALYLSSTPGQLTTVSSGSVIASCIDPTSYGSQGTVLAALRGLSI